MTRANPCITYDITLWCDKISKELTLAAFKENCRSWTFQQEKGAGTGKLHYQARIKCKTKVRPACVARWFPKGSCHVSVTSSANRDNMFYVLKADTRVDGPWSDTDTYVPRQIRELKTLYPWQQKVITLSKVWDTRTVHVIVDTEGNIGKTVLCTYMGVFKHAISIPYCNDYKDIMRMAMDRPKRGCYLIDLPRAINKERLYQMYSGIETLKSGYCWDDRYKFREEYFDCPSIFVFTNQPPNLSLLSRDRWKLWCVRKGELVQWSGFCPK